MLTRPQINKPLLVNMGVFPSKVTNPLQNQGRPYQNNLYIPPTPNTFFSGYHVDPLLKKEVFTLDNQVLQKTP